MLPEWIRVELCRKEEGAAVLSALEQLLEMDRFLLVVDANERSITHRLAMHLQEEFAEWDVDCEYNRDGHDPKEMYLRGDDPTVRDTDAKTVYPDIIIHHRGEEDNLLVIEVKKTSSRVGPDDDFQKLAEYQHQLGYRRGLFIEFAVGPREPGIVEARWVDGR